MKTSSALRAIKIIHTLIWAFFAGCIVAIPLFSQAGRFVISSALIAVVTVEVLIVAFNQGRCPLTAIAARYTEERQDNFDIYLPNWLARHNKAIFGALFLVGALYTLMAWLTGHGAA